MTILFKFGQKLENDFFPPNDKALIQITIIKSYIFIAGVEVTSKYPLLNLML